MDDINFVYKLVKGSIKQTITQMGKKNQGPLDRFIDELKESHNDSKS